jgi:hypothetical protein
LKIGKILLIFLKKIFVLLFELLKTKHLKSDKINIYLLYKIDLRI